MYVHIPFCRQKCAYCDFLSFPCGNDRLLTEYSKALALEIRSRRADCEDYTVDSVFIGGGTPSLLPIDAFQRIMTELQHNFRIDPDAEITVEANPASLTKEKMEQYLESGVNRLSIGVQSFDNGILKILGRLHDKNQAFNMIQNARKAGFDNINIDLMFGIPTQTSKVWIDTLRQGIFLRPQHISLYSLQLEEGTEMYRRVYEDRTLTATPEIIDREMYHDAIALLRKSGYRHYEISNAALPGYEGKHNGKYWAYQEYLGIGLGASSFFKGSRFRNHERMSSYIKAIKENRVPVDEASVEHYTERDEMGIFVFTGLRRAEGVSLDAFRRQFGMDLFSVYDPAILRRHKGLINLYDDHLYLTEAGMDVSNTVMAEFV